MLEKVLIIKLGFSETLRDDNQRTCSYGDVVRTTVLLNYFNARKYHITWLVDQKALPILKDCPKIDRIMCWNHESTLVLQQEHFDIVINLEKVPGTCALTNVLSGDKYGFRWDGHKGVVKSYNNADRVLDIVNKGKNTKTFWQTHLANVIRKVWKPTDRYILAERNTSIRYDVGLNYNVGSKWKNKAWKMENWTILEKMLVEKNDLRVSWQPSNNNPEEYMDWISSCAMVITCDTLGMHLALAYGKKVVALFGPSPSSEIYMYNQGEIVLPKSDLKCIPCLKPECIQKTCCMDMISPIQVYNAVENVRKTK